MKGWERNPQKVSRRGFVLMDQNVVSITNQGLGMNLIVVIVQVTVKEITITTIIIITIESRVHLRLDETKCNAASIK